MYRRCPALLQIRSHGDVPPGGALSNRPLERQQEPRHRPGVLGAEKGTGRAGQAERPHDLGQLWAYCKLCDPTEAFLLSSLGLGSLNKIMINLHRTDLLDFGDGKIIKKMQIAKWDVAKKTLDYKSIVPKI